MQLKRIDVAHATKLLSYHVDTATCIECCKFYIAPERSSCGHTLCHTCWRIRRTCPICTKPLDKCSLKLDSPLQNLTQHIRELIESFEKLFGVKMDEYIIDTPLESKETDPTKNVKEWLTSSDNHFSAPPYSNTQQSTQDVLLPIQLELSTSKIQIHTETNKNASPPKIAHVSAPQDDWDKVEVVPDTEEIFERNKENIVGPMDLEPFCIVDNEYSTDNPRRSSRKKDHNKDYSLRTENVTEKLSSNNSSGETDKKMDKAKQNWTRVKKMRKEFSKLSKVHKKSKLNISIEMCKKTQSAISKQNSATPPNENIDEILIDDNTPNIHRDEKLNAPLGIPDKMDINEDLIDCSNLKKAESPKKSCKNNSQACKQQSDSLLNINNEIKPSTHRLKNADFDKVNLDLVERQQCDKQPSKESSIGIPFFRKAAIKELNRNENSSPSTYVSSAKNTSNPDDIHITIKIGDVVTNITINKKQNDVQLNVKTDREVQTSLGPDVITEMRTVQRDVKNTNEESNIQVENNKSVKVQCTQTNLNLNKEVQVNSPSVVKIQLPIEKSTSSKKHTASAETATAQFEITESVEKELSNIMDCEDMGQNYDAKIIKPAQNSHKNEVSNKSNSQNTIISKTNKDIEAMTTDMDANISENSDKIDIDDIDIFQSGSLKNQNIQWLKDTKNAPSEIIAFTNKTSKSKVEKNVDKRNRDLNDEDDVPNKRQKLNKNYVSKNSTTSPVKKRPIENDSPDYDELMGQVFANIDADMHVKENVALENSSQIVTSSTKRSNTPKTNQKNVTKYSVHNITQVQVSNKESKKTQNIVNLEKYSENMFSTVGNVLDKGNTNVPGPETQQHIANLLTPKMCQDFASAHDDGHPEEIVVHATPHMDDDSDKSIVEETPQKSISSNPRSRSDSGNRTVVNNKKLQLNKQKVNEDKVVSAIVRGKTLDSEDICSIINLTDTVRESGNNHRSTSIAPISHKLTLETPLTINRFVDQIKHKSTPVARKSLNFTRNADNDDDVTLCPTNNTLVAKTTQEREFMCEAFENSCKSPARNPLIKKNASEEKSQKFCIAGSCLTSTELTNLKILCFKRKWTYVDKYTPNLTHLVVAVDEECKSQRSVKYMCALAAGKWIVSCKWVEKCLQTNTVVSEEPFEALDSTGNPGPRLSRTAQSKLFEGFTFYCLPPFSVLDVDTLISMLEAAGGLVVKEVNDIRARSESPAVLLAEPEHTQEDKFMYLAMELGIVPVNYEWALNCLGSYSLCSLYDLLLCPVALLPKAIEKWPSELMSSED